MTDQSEVSRPVCSLRASTLGVGFARFGAFFGELTDCTLTLTLNRERDSGCFEPRS